MPSATSARAATRNAAAIVEACRPELQALEFIHRSGKTLWRRTNLKFDILKFGVIPNGKCQKWRIPMGSFSLDPSCLFPFLPRLGHLPVDGWRPDRGFGQLRLSLRRGMPQPQVGAPNLWWAGDSTEVFDMVLMDILGVIRDKALPFFHRFEDPEEVLRTFLEDEDAIGCEGVWDFGRKGSVDRLLYTGFAAIECGKWDIAISSLRACREKTMTILPPMRESIAAETLPYIDQGIACAAQQRQWSGV